jgi:putative transposase
MIKTYKYEIYPNLEQKSKIDNFIGCARFIYNWGLERKTKSFIEENKQLSCFTLINEIVKLKETEEYSWLNDCHSQILQMSLRNLDNAFTNFFRKRGKFPKFKSKKYAKQTIHYPQGVYIEGNNIFIPKIKKVPFDNHRQFEGKIKTVTLRKSSTNRYFVSILVEDDKKLPIKNNINEKTTIGLDLGIIHFAISSTGEIFENQKYFYNSEKKLRVENRKLSRKYVRGLEEQSKNYIKQKLVVAKLQEKIKNQRKDFLHKLSKQLIDKYDTICIEDLDVQKMMKNPQYARRITDCGWGYFKLYLEYKADWYGKNLIFINKFEPSSKMCNKCGDINQNLKITDRTWTCSNCNTVLDRDLNAAINIKNIGLRLKPLDVKTVH